MMADTKHAQQIISEIARLAREMNFLVLVSESNTTESTYASIGVRSANGGFAIMLKVRVSSHAKPGFRSGWHDRGKAAQKAGCMPQYHAKLGAASARKAVSEVSAFLSELDPRPFYGCNRFDESKIAPQYRMGVLPS
jgi:hypothetical protein